MKYYKYLNIPNFLTLLRIVMVPFFTVFFYLPMYWSSVLCSVIFCFAGITDWFDGFLARKWKQTSKFGRFFDPLADKIMIITALILVSEHFHVWWITLPISSIITREIIIAALREWIAKIDNRNDITVIQISKIKTFIQMLALTVLLLRSNEWIVIIGVFTLYTAVILTLWSMCYYLYIAFCILLNN